MKDTLLLQKAAAYDNEQLSVLIERHVKGRHAERNRAILKRRIIDGIGYDALAEEFDLSIRQTQNIVYAGIKILLLAI